MKERSHLDVELVNMAVLTNLTLTKMLPQSMKEGRHSNVKLVTAAFLKKQCSCNHHDTFIAETLSKAMRFI